MAVFNHLLLALVLLLPPGGAVALFFIRRHVTAVRWTAFGVTLGVFFLSLLFPISIRHQRGEVYTDSPGGSVQTLLGPSGSPSSAIDGLSLPFIWVTTLLFCITCLASWNDSERPTEFLVFLLLLEFITLQSFTAFDLSGFCFSVATVPSLLLLVLSAAVGPDRYLRRIAAVLIIGFGLLALAIVESRTSGQNLLHLPTGKLLFALTAAAFLIRSPITPFHGWFTGVARIRSSSAAMLACTILPLTGGYGLIRLAMPLLPPHAGSWAIGLAVWGVVAIFYGSLAALGEDDLRRMIAQLAVVTMGFFVLGLATFTPLGLNGAVLILLGGVLTIALMILLAGIRSNSSTPMLGGFFAAAAFALIVAPVGLGAWMTLLGMFEAARADSALRVAASIGPARIDLLAGAGCLGAVLFAAAVLRLMRRSFASATASTASSELKLHEFWSLIPLAAAILLLGIFCKPLCFTFTRTALSAMFRHLH